MWYEKNFIISGSLSYDMLYRMCPKERKTNNKWTVIENACCVFFCDWDNSQGCPKYCKHYRGELFAIEPKSPYTRADLDWHDEQSRSSIEMNNVKSRPALKGLKANMADYDVVFLGYPIWWNCAPRIINTFIESHNLKGKTIIPFATSGSSSISNSVTELKKAYPNLDWQTGKLLNRVNNNDLQSWIKSVVRWWSVRQN